MIHLYQPATNAAISTPVLVAAASGGVHHDMVKGVAMKRFSLSLIVLSGLSQQTFAAETIFDVYRIIGDTEYFPLVETLDGHSITNSFDWRLDTRIEEESNFIAYLEEGGGWSISAYKFWPLSDGGAIAVTSSASFEVEIMYPDTYVQFFARGPGDEWGEIDPPMPFVDVSDFLGRSPALETRAARDMLKATEWALYYDLGPDTELLTIRLTATNRDKCWPETIFGSNDDASSGDEEFSFCRDVYSGLFSELKFELDPDTGRFALQAP